MNMMDFVCSATFSGFVCFSCAKSQSHKASARGEKKSNQKLSEGKWRESIDRLLHITMAGTGTVTAVLPLT